MVGPSRSGKGQEGEQRDGVASQPRKDNDKPSIPPMSYARILGHADRLDVALMIVGTIGALIAGAALPAFTVVFSNFTDTFGRPGPDFTSTVAQLSITFIVLAVIGGVACYTETACWMSAGNRLTNKLRKKYLAVLLQQEIGFFDTQATTGELLQGLNEDALDVQAGISEKAGHFIRLTSQFVFGFGVAFYRGWDMALVMLGLLPFMAAIASVLGKRTSKMISQSNEAYAKANAIAQQSISQIRTVAAFSGEPIALNSYESALDTPYKVGVRHSFLLGLTLGGMLGVVYVSYAVALVYGAHRVAAGAYTGGMVLNVIMATIMGGFSLGMAGPLLQHFYKARVAAARMALVWNRATHIPLDSSNKKLEKVRGELDVRDLHFCYPSRLHVEVLSGFSLVVPAGGQVALVGGSGCGKSTLVALVERFYDPQQGAVCLDGVDIRTLNLRWLRQQVGLVSQEPTLFGTTIYNNIAMGKPGATQQEVEAAAAASYASSFIAALPAGYQTQVGERGVALSGGQKQRIAIARAVLKNPKVLLLDEATSALDSRSEALVSAALASLSAGRTSLVIAHRLSTVQGADIIAVLGQGRVLEQGSHDQLMQDKEGAYQALVQLQLQKGKGSGREKLEGGGRSLVQDGSSGGSGGSGLDVHGVVAGGGLGGIGAAAAAGGGGGGGGVGDEVERKKALQGMLLDDALPGGIVVQHPAAYADTAAAGAGALGPQMAFAAPHETTVVVGISSAGASAAAAAGAADSSEEVSRGVLKLAGATAAPKQYKGAVAGTTTATAAGEAAAASVTPASSSLMINGENSHLTDHSKGSGTPSSSGSISNAAPVESSFLRLAKLNKPEWRYALIGGIGSAGAGIQQPAYAFLFTSVVAALYLPTPELVREKGTFWGLLFLVVAVGGMLAALLLHSGFGIMGHALARRIRVMMFEAMLRQEIGWFDREENASGKLAARMATDAAHVRGAVGDVFGLLVQNLVMLACGFLIAYVYDWRMALVVTALLPLAASAGFLQMKFNARATSAIDELYSRSSQQVSEALSNIRMVAAYNLQHYMEGMYGELVQVAEKTVMKNAQVTGFSLGYSQLMMFGIYSLIIWFGGLEIASGRATFDQMLKALFAVLFAAMGLAQSTMNFPDVSKAKSAINSIFPIMDRPSAIDPCSPEGLTFPAEAVRGELEIKEVGFHYPTRPSVEVLSGFSLFVPAGGHVALVGGSGCGKSTLVALVERFYDSQQGAVCLDGVDIRTLNLRWLRQQLGLVSQEPLLFEGTILDNIKYSKPSATQEEVEAAAAAAHATDFVEELPERYQTQVGERGVALSGGQKQRIAIARAVLKNPKVLLLDEATSALDSRSEALVSAALASLSAGRTSLVIAHRLSTVQGADIIAVLGQGRVLEQGSHDQLMQHNEGAYVQLVKAQMVGAHV